MARWSISNLWTPSKQTKEQQAVKEADPAPSPLAEQHPNRIQKPRDNKSSTYTRKGKTRTRKLAAQLANSSALDEISDSDGRASRRESHVSASHDDGIDEPMEDPEQPASDSNENESPEDDEAIEFATQPPAPTAPVSPGVDLETQDQDDIDHAVVTATPGEASEDELAGDVSAPQDDAAGPLSDKEEQGNEEKEGGEEADESDDEQYTFTSLLDYRWDDDAIEIKVQWHGSESTWEPETNLHRDAPDTLFRFWKARGGRPENPRDPGLYDIFAIRGHNKNRQRLLVEWTGYPPSENCWVSRKLLRQTAPEVVAEYWKSMSQKG